MNAQRGVGVHPQRHATAVRHPQNWPANHRRALDTTNHDHP